MKTFPGKKVRSRVRRPSPATLMSAAALFISLGGTALATTQGFILGTTNRVDAATAVTNVKADGTQNEIANRLLGLTNLTTATGATALALNVASGHAPFTTNSATRVTNLNADKLDGIDSTGFVKNAPPISLTGPGGEDVLTARNAGNGRGLAGFSDSWQGVYGHSNGNAGVVGESLNFDGVYGVSQSATHAAVSAHNDAFGGFGVWAAGGDRANGTAAIHGQSAKGNAVEGISSGSPSSGVYGQDDNANSYGVAGHSNNGAALVGDSPNGWAVQSLGNATQSRAGGGFVKAIVYIDPGAANPIRRCFNSQLPAAQATSVPCGMSYSRGSNGVSDVDFGFQVSDRFISISLALPQANAPGARAYSTDVVRVDQDLNQPCSPFCATPSPYYLFVY